MILTIYLLGVIASYFMLRKLFRHYYTYSWKDVLINLMFSVLFSWIHFVAGLFFYIKEYTEDKGSVPPKWL